MRLFTGMGMKGCDCTGHKYLSARKLAQVRMCTCVCTRAWVRAYIVGLCSISYDMCMTVMSQTVGQEAQYCQKGHDT